MRTAISIPDPLFRAAEELARETGRSRDDLFAEALSEYVARRAPRASDEEITARLNRVCAEADTAPDGFLREMQARSIPKEDW